MGFRRLPRIVQRPSGPVTLEGIEVSEVADVVKYVVTLRSVTKDAQLEGFVADADVEAVGEVRVRVTDYGTIVIINDAVRYGVTGFVEVAGDIPEFEFTGCIVVGITEGRTCASASV